MHERTLGALKTGGVNTAGDIAARYMRDMYKVQGIGKRDIFAMQGALKKLGLTFRPEEEKPEGKKDRQSRRRRKSPRRITATGRGRKNSPKSRSAAKRERKEGRKSQDPAKKSRS